MEEDFSMFSGRKDMDEKDYYLSKDGYIVFTEDYHLKRGDRIHGLYHGRRLLTLRSRVLTKN